MTLSDLRPVTLISGKNNVGKSSILEGIFLFFDHISPDSFMKISQFRGGTFPLHTVSLWETFFYKMDADNYSFEGDYPQATEVADCYVNYSDEKITADEIDEAKKIYTLIKQRIYENMGVMGKLIFT